MYTIKEVAQICNISISKIRYLDKQRVLRPNLKRDENNYRIFTNEDIVWINDIMCFQNTNMSIKQIQEITISYEQKNYPRLKQIFLEHERKVLKKLQIAQKNHQRVLEKIDYYEEKIKENNEKF